MDFIVSHCVNKDIHFLTRRHGLTHLLQQRIYNVPIAKPYKVL